MKKLALMAGCIVGMIVLAGLVLQSRRESDQLSLPEIVWVRAEEAPYPWRDVRASPDGAAQQFGNLNVTSDAGGVLVLWDVREMPLIRSLFTGGVTHLSTGERHEASGGGIWLKMQRAVEWHRDLAQALGAFEVADPDFAVSVCDEFDRRRVSFGQFPATIWVHDNTRTAASVPGKAQFAICGERVSDIDAVGDRVVVISSTVPATGPTATYERTAMPRPDGWAPFRRMRPLEAYVVVGNWTARHPTDPDVKRLRRIADALVPAQPSGR